MRKRLGLAALLLSLFIFLGVTEGPGEAAVVALSLEELAAGADVCVRGVVVEARPAWTPDGGMIETTVTILPQEVLKGAPADALSVMVPGGDLQGIHIRNSEAPVFEVGQQVVVFAKRNPDGVFETLGCFQGKLTILDGMVREMKSTSWDSLRAQILATVERK